VRSPLGDLEEALSTHVVKGFRMGTDRLIDPGETLAKMRPLMPLMGITRIAMITGLDRIGIPVAVAIRPNARSLATSQGKGLTADLARTSALMEAAELFHAERSTLPLKFNCRRELQDTGHVMIDLDTLPKTPDARLDDDLEICWVESINLIDNTPLWIPYDLVHTNYTLPAVRSCHAFNATSNGLASGNHLAESLVSALCEVVERDATTLWQQQTKNSRDGSLVDLSTVQDTHCSDILGRFDKANVAVAVWEVTSDVGVPVFSCTIVDREDSAFRPTPAASGMGCHLDRRIALSRALTEAAQSRLTVMAGSRDDVSWKDYSRFHDRAVIALIRSRILEACPKRSFDEAPTVSHDTFSADIAYIVERFRRLNITQVAAVNLTRPDLNVPVVRVVAGGLEAPAASPDYVRGSRALSLLGETA
jgi:YcaO-like protein with predicted kinase domain